MEREINYAARQAASIVIVEAPDVDKPICRLLLEGGVTASCPLSADQQPDCSLVLAEKAGVLLKDVVSRFCKMVPSLREHRRE